MSHLKIVIPFNLIQRSNKKKVYTYKILIQQLTLKVFNI